MVDMKIRMGNHIKAREVVATAFERMGADKLRPFSSHSDFIYSDMRVAVRSATINRRKRDWSYRNEMGDDIDIFVFIGYGIDGEVDHICVIPYYMMTYNSYLKIHSRKQYTYAPYMCGVDGIKSKIDSIIDEWDDIKTYSDRHR